MIRLLVNFQTILFNIIRKIKVPEFGFYKIEVPSKIAHCIAHPASCTSFVSSLKLFVHELAKAQAGFALLLVKQDLVS